LFDFTVFPGNSGGPVYFVEHSPTINGTVKLGLTVQGIEGIVIEERSFSQKVKGLYEERTTKTSLRLGEVVHASFIKELVESMGFPE
jgi:hypothetical protein